MDTTNAMTWARGRRALPMATLLALLAALLLASPALAGRTWCYRDPIVRLNGTDLQVWVAVPNDYVALVNGPVQVTYRIPAGVAHEVIFTDEGFNGHGETVRFVEDANLKVSKQGIIPVRIRVQVPIDRKLAVARLQTTKIPLRLRVVENGQEKIVTAWSDGAWITTKVKDGK